MSVPSFYFVQFLYSTEFQNVRRSKMKYHFASAVALTHQTPISLNSSTVSVMNQSEQAKQTSTFILFARNSFVLHEFLM